MGRASTVSARALGGEGFPRQAVVVEALHPRGDELGLHLVQIVVPEVGLLPVEEVEGPHRSLAEILFQFSVCRLSGGLVVAFGHRVYDSSPLGL